MDKFNEAPQIEGGRMIVIASGPSGAGPWPKHPGVPVVAVNGAVDGLPWAPDFWFTQHPSPENMRRLRELKPETTPIIAAEMDVGPHAKLPLYRQDFGRALILCLKRRHEDTFDRRIISYGNSGRGAIHFAMHAGATMIAVFGVDGTDDPHWHDPAGHSGNLNALGKGCAMLRREGVEIVFANSGQSTVQGQIKMRPKTVMNWILDKE